MNDVQEQLRDHETRIQSLESTRADTLKALSELDGKHERRLSEVKADLQERLNRIESDAKERDRENAKRLDKFAEKLDEIAQMFAQAIKQTPPWVWPVISAILAIAAWFIGSKG